MGNKQSGNVVPYAYRDFQMVNLAKDESEGSENDEEKQSLFNIFHVPINSDIGIITQPLTAISTNEYSAVFQIAFSEMQKENTSGKHKLEDGVYIQEFEKEGDQVFIASVLDGHEGIQTMDFVVEHLFNMLAERLFENPENIKGVIKDSFQTVDSLYCEEKGNQLSLLIPSKKCCFPCFKRTSEININNLHLGSGCVLTLLCIHNNSLILAGLGDCGICFSIGGRSCYSLVRHNPSNKLEKQRVETAGGVIKDNRIDGWLQVSRSIGDVWFKPSYHSKKNEIDCSQDFVIAEPDIAIYPLSNDIEFCIIGSDGVFSAITYQDAVNIVKNSILKGRSGEEACQEIIEKCRTKTDDDISIILLFFHIDEHTQSHLPIEDDIFVKSRCYSSHKISDDKKEEEDYPSLYHSISEVSLSLNATRQSCRDPFRVGLYDIFDQDDDASTHVSLELPEIKSPRE